VLIDSEVQGESYTLLSMGVENFKCITCGNTGHTKKPAPNTPFFADLGFKNRTKTNIGRVRSKRVWVQLRVGYKHTHTRTRPIPIPDLF